MWSIRQNPDEKIVVWTANLHAAHNLYKAEYAANDNFYQIYKPMGSHLKEIYADKVFSIAFTSVEGQTATIYDSDAWEIDLEKESWDMELSKHIADDHAFVNFENIRQNKYCADHVFNSTLLGYRMKKGAWFSIFDGVFFIRKMERSIMIQ